MILSIVVVKNMFKLVIDYDNLVIKLNVIFFWEIVVFFVKLILMVYVSILMVCGKMIEKLVILKSWFVIM